MECPNCTTPTMSLKDEGNPGLYTCDTCEGIWVSSSSMGKMAPQKESLNKFFDASLRSYNRLCPTCKLNLFESCFPNTQVLTDGCKGCEGFWFDKGEFEEVSKRLNPDSALSVENISNSQDGSSLESAVTPSHSSNLDVSSRHQTGNNQAEDSTSEIFKDAVSFSIYQRKELLETWIQLISATIHTASGEG